MRISRLVAGVAAVLLTALGQPPAPPQPPADSRPTISTTAEEVVLDLIVRDKKGRPVRDLKAEEIEILDGGQPAKVKSLRFAELEQSTTAESKKLDPLRQIRLVTLLFDSLTVEPAIQARAAAHELVKAGSGPNVYFSIFRMANRLQALQSFSNDGPALHQAIDQFTGNRANFQFHADRIEASLNLAAPGGSAGATDAYGKPLDPSGAILASLMLNILSTALQDSKDVESRPIIGALRAAADQMRDLPGRKTIVYFTEGWNLTFALKDQFKALISAANRANVSFYIVDASGLVTGSRNDAARKMLAKSVALSSSQGSATTSFEQARGVDTTLESMNANTQTALMDLAGSTGGTFIADSNDLRKPMTKLVEDVNAYYELNYTPAGRQMDAHFRDIKVKVDRPGVRVQARSGYFDLPHGSRNLKGSWEVSALKALEGNSDETPGFAFQAKAFPLRRHAGEVTGELVYRIPMAALEPEENASTKTFRLRFGVVALFRDTNGKVIHKVSREIGHEGALDAWERAKTLHYSVTQPFVVPAGAYSVEMAAVDAVSSKIALLRLPVSFTAEAGALDMGGPLVVERLEPVGAQTAGSDPLRYEKSRVLPSVSNEPIKQEGLPLFFLIRPLTATAVKPELTLEIRRQGQLFTTLRVPVPDAKEALEIPYVATLPTAALGGGKFELLARLRQGDATVDRRLDFTIEGEPRVFDVLEKMTAGAPSMDSTLPVPDMVAAPLHADLKPKSEDEARILEGARKRALEYAANLPNFVCMQVTRRFEQPVGRKSSEWKEIDNLSEQVTYVDGHEHYQKINGLERGNDMGRGVLSAGEFGGLLRMVFRPESKAQLKWHDLEIDNGRKMHVFEYSIARGSSQYMVRPNHSAAAVAVAAKGLLTIDEETYQIRKIALAAVDLPKKFPFQESVIEVEYDSFSLGEQFAMLPRRATVRVAAGHKVSRNAIEYLNYRKWTGTSELKFTEPEKPH